MDPCYVHDQECIDGYKSTQTTFYVIVGIAVAGIVIVFVLVLVVLYIRQRIRSGGEGSDAKLKRIPSRLEIQKRIDMAKAKKVNE